VLAAAAAPTTTTATAAAKTGAAAKSIHNIAQVPTRQRKQRCAQKGQEVFLCKVARKLRHVYS